MRIARTVSLLVHSTIVAGLIGLAMSGAVSQAHADPGDDPCQLVAGLLCKFVPMAPELDGDVDLTNQQPSADPSAPEPDSRRPADICANGCM